MTSTFEKLTEIVKASTPPPGGQRYIISRKSPQATERPSRSMASTKSRPTALPKQFLQGFVPKLQVSCSRMKKKIPGTLRKRKESDAGFERRNYRRSRNPLDLLELLWIISEEVGGKFNRIERPAAAAAKDTSLKPLYPCMRDHCLFHEKFFACCTADIPWRVKPLRRSLHELTVTAAFLKSQDQEVSHRYLASFHLLRCVLPSS